MMDRRRRRTNLATEEPWGTNGLFNGPPSVPGVHPYGEDQQGPQALAVVIPPGLMLVEVTADGFGAEILVEPPVPQQTLLRPGA